MLSTHDVGKGVCSRNLEKMHPASVTDFSGNESHATTQRHDLTITPFPSHNNWFKYYFFKNCERLG